MLQIKSLKSFLLDECLIDLRKQIGFTDPVSNILAHAFGLWFVAAMLVCMCTTVACDDPKFKTEKDCMIAQRAISRTIPMVMLGIKAIMFLGRGNDVSEEIASLRQEAVAIRQEAAAIRLEAEQINRSIELIEGLNRIERNMRVSLPYRMSAHRRMIGVSKSCATTSIRN